MTKPLLKQFASVLLQALGLNPVPSRNNYSNSTPPNPPETAGGES